MTEREACLWMARAEIRRGLAVVGALLLTLAAGSLAVALWTLAEMGW